MLSDENVKIINEYPEYSVSKYGLVIKTKTRHIVTHFCHGGYYSVNIKIGDVDNGYKYKALKDGEQVFKTTAGLVKRFFVHRLVANAFCINDDPINKTYINHKDGNPSNNRWDNLEWVTPSENVRDALENGLRLDNVSVRVRNFDTGEVKGFYSISEAKRYMKVPINTRTVNLIPKRFGQLVNGRYEVRFKNDNRPWFYENRFRKVSSRYMAKAIFPDATEEEFFSSEDMVIRFDKLPSISTHSTLPEMVNRARVVYPDVEFSIRSSDEEDPYPDIRKYISNRTKIIAFNIKTKEEIFFNGLHKTAWYFKCSNRSIRERLDSNIPYLKEWLFARETDQIRVEDIRKQLNGIVLSNVSHVS